MQKNKASISEIGLDLLEKNLAETQFSNAFDIRRIFSLLAENETEKVIELLSNSLAKAGESAIASAIPQKTEEKKPKSLSDFS